MAVTESEDRRWRVEDGLRETRMEDGWLRMASTRSEGRGLRVEDGDPWKRDRRWKLETKTNRAWRIEYGVDTRFSRFEGLSDGTAGSTKDIFAVQEVISPQVSKQKGKEMPHIRFAVAAPLAISRGFAISGLSSGRFTRGGVLGDSHLPRATYMSPRWGFILLLPPSLRSSDAASRRQIHCCQTV